MNGYNTMTGLMVSFPSVAVFRRFLPLNVRNLLYLQAELVYLEADLKGAILADARSGEGHNNACQFSVEALMSLANDPKRYTQKDKTLQIRQKLKEYSKLTVFQVYNRLMIHLLQMKHSFKSSHCSNSRSPAQSTSVH